MKIKKLILLFSLIFILAGVCEAKKIKHSFKIEKEQKNAGKKNTEEIKKGKAINLKDSLIFNSAITESVVDTISGLEINLLQDLKKCLFAGFDKEVNSSKESFILKNDSQQKIIGFIVRIDYLDMKGRMLHSRTIEEEGEVPPGETRRFDIRSWDIQHTYYYYRGNEPKKVATPFDVKFTPEVFFIEDSL